MTETKPNWLTSSVSVTLNGFCLVTHQVCIHALQYYLSIIRFAMPTFASTYCKPVRNHVLELVVTWKAPPRFLISWHYITNLLLLYLATTK